MNRSNNVTTEEYCKDLLQQVIGWEEQRTKQARLLDAQAVNTSDYAKREALIKVAEVNIYTAKQTGECISEYMGEHCHQWKGNYTQRWALIVCLFLCLKHLENFRLIGGYAGK